MLAASLLLVAALGLVAIVLKAVAASTRSDQAKPPAPPVALEVRVGARPVLRIALAPLQRRGEPAARSLSRAIAARLPQRIRVRRGTGRVTLRLDTDQTVARARALASSGGVVQAVATAERARIAAPVIKQAFRNNCETAALAILMTMLGAPVDQRHLQAQLLRSGPADPRGDGAQMVWGDPDRGFVGRVMGGGRAGGFGVYPGPIAALARHHDVTLRDLTGSSIETVARRLLAGRAVIAWVGLSDGPYGRWQTPDGRDIRVNFGEHTVVLTGIDADGALTVVNPLQGTRETWSASRFIAMWERLGRRALSA